MYLHSLSNAYELITTIDISKNNVPTYILLVVTYLKVRSLPERTFKQDVTNVSPAL